MHVFILPIYRKPMSFRKKKHSTVPVSCGYIGDEITLTDGKGSFYKAEITAATNKRCLVAIKETIFQNHYGRATCTSPWHQLKIWTVMNGLPRKPLK